MTRRRHDLTGQQFGLLEALDDGPRDRNGERRYRCRCACGAVRLVRVSFLRNGTTRSCGAPACRQQIRPKPTPRKSAKEWEQERAVAALVAAGGYGGAHDARNWRDTGSGRVGPTKPPRDQVALPFVRATGRSAARPTLEAGGR
jgi:hypothetical protein